MIATEANNLYDQYSLFQSDTSYEEQLDDELFQEHMDSLDKDMIQRTFLPDSYDSDSYLY